MTAAEMAPSSARASETRTPRSPSLPKPASCAKGAPLQSGTLSKCVVTETAFVEKINLAARAAHALKAGLDELTPHAGPRWYGVVFGEVDAPCGDPTQPVQRHRRWRRDR